MGNLHKQFLRFLLHGGTPLLILNQGKASCQNAEVSFVAYERLTIVLALHASNSICCVTHAFAVLHQ